MTATTKKAAARPTQPQDRKPKSEEEAPEVRTVELRGREWTIPLEALDDFEFLDDMTIIQQGGDEAPVRLAPALRRLVGADQWRQAMDVCRNDSGRVTIEAGARFLMDLMGALNPNS